jgi:hypothetical protein
MSLHLQGFAYKENSINSMVSLPTPQISLFMQKNFGKHFPSFVQFNLSSPLQFSFIFGGWKDKFSTNS